jgi:hypothetical protein
MGRATNSFSAWVGQTNISGDRVELPETGLWIAVLTRAVLDAVKGPPHLDMSKRANISHKNHYTYDRDQARHFFMEGGKHFRYVCTMAGRNPDYVQQKIRKLLLRKNGWNVDVPITSHYRQGRKRGKRKSKYKKKHLTGNAYYAAKAKKNFYYEGIGAKGGRPRIYNKIET